MSDEIGAMDGDEVELRDAPLYERTGRTRCQAMDIPFALVTLDGGIEAGEIGDYLCEAILSDGSPGPRFAVPAKRFSALYRLILPPSLAPAEPGEFGADRKPLAIPVELWGDTLPVDDVLVAADDEVAV